MTQKFSLVAMAREQLDKASASRGGHAAGTVVGGHERVLRQTLMAFAKGAEQSEHQANGEATVYVLSGRVRIVAGDDSWEIMAGDLLVIPEARHRLEALEDSALLLTVAIPR
ncbi:LuxR family transcriptional regulator [Sphaerisporangium melleum]|uniref:LuxR family transcriptional regulator n=1 Tax=Sphaerisporangium melleum TaxID=321316 RepID=A0A917QYK2_9ACTN|nr:cupin domain-containing protein [Sphaerisporangium melleum]GGK75352.1 LuxR family transcriptional regulator [Sphaerisporangium melleum]GII72621.1 LuxR family transcriptional regulator [Sphaerisporangium melleum]